MGGPSPHRPVAHVTLARVRIETLDTEVSALGFGCASLGSRVASEAGIAALARAHDAGVTWFDVAPSYGDGQAERLLGLFLKTRPRDAVQVLTKVGIAPPAPSLKARLLRPAMRVAVAALPSLRAAVRQRRPAATKLPLNADLISESIDASLRRLGIDYVDVLALHDASPEEVIRDDVLRALETAVTSGKARAAAIASSPKAAVAGVAASGVYRLAQMSNNLLDPGLERFRSSGNWHVDLVTHSVFGNEGAVAYIAARIERDAAFRSLVTATGYEGKPSAVAADLLADFAFTDNPQGVVLASMFAEHHLHHNLARHALHRESEKIRVLATHLEPDHI
ncbi:MAG: aldo/keto reductase [Spirochaetia bacterium]|nr:MAG: aldo/keto reductase [Spirochaetia bacterium]